MVGQVEGEAGVYAPLHVSHITARGYSLGQRRLVFEEVLKVLWMEEKTLGMWGAINCQNVIDGLESWAFLGISNQRRKGKASTLGSMGIICQKINFPESPARQGP